MDVDVAWPTDNWAFPSLVPEERSYTAPGKLWLENASLSYVVVMNLVNRALQKGLRPYPFCSRHENSHSHYHQFLLTLPDEGLNRAALMILAMGLHDPDKMGGDGHDIFRAVHSWLPFMFRATATAYLDACYVFMTQDVMGSKSDDELAVPPPPTGALQPPLSCRKNLVDPVAASSQEH